MASIGRTLFRFGGALVLGASATAIDDPGVLFAPSPDAPVVVALKDIPAGSAIDPGSIALAHWPAVTVPSAAYRSIDSVAGRVSRVGIFKGEAIVPDRLAPEGTAAGLEVKITPGKRAFGIRLGGGADIAGMIQPNSRVDVLVVVDRGSDRGRVARLFMENMRVLAFSVAQYGAVATLEVTPEEAERLAIASTQGQIRLVLHGYGDPDSIAISAAPLHDLLFRHPQRVPFVAPRRAVAPGADTFRVKVFRGDSSDAVRARRDTSRP